MPVAHPASHHLKLYTEHSPKVVRPPIEAIGSLPEVLRAFQTITGWSLRYVTGAEPKPDEASRTGRSRSTPGEGSPPGHLRLEPLDSAPAADAARTAVDFETARALALAIAGMLNELQQTRHVLWQREAELAAGVPLVPLSDEESHLAEKLQTTLARRGRGRRLPGRRLVLDRRSHHRAEDAFLLGPAFRTPHGAGPADERRVGRSGSPFRSCRGLGKHRADARLESAGGFRLGRVRAGCLGHHAVGHALGIRRRSARIHRSASAHHRDRGRQTGRRLGTRNAPPRRHRRCTP